jgi:hypothetical protein
MNGMIVTVAMKVALEPSAPRMPNFLFQNPTNNSVPNVHSETPKDQVALRIPKERIKPEDERAIADIRDQPLDLVLEPFLIPKEEENDHHRRTDQVISEVVVEDAELAEYPYKEVPQISVGTASAGAARGAE